jgi:hypothetical protein
VKHQYAGDVNDYLKYALLRRLTERDARRLLVCWMLTPDDGRGDGRLTRYLDDPSRWRALDPELFDALRALRDGGGARGVGEIERAGLLPGARFQSEMLGDDGREREAYFARTRALARGRELVFFDPDNGMEVPSTPRGRRNSSKYLYRDELARTYADGHSVLVYQHFPRAARGPFVSALKRRLMRLTGAPEARAFRTERMVFLLLPQPRQARRYRAITLR